MDGSKEIWEHSNEWGTNAAVADDGGLAFCHTGETWTLFNYRGERLAVIHNSPMEWELDPPRTCWTHNDSRYIELSQGNIYEVGPNQWRKAEEPAGVPNEVRRHRGRPVSNEVLGQFLKAPVTVGIPPSFRHLTSRQVEQLRLRLKAGEPRAALVLGLARCQKARAELLKSSFAPNSEPAEEAQRAVLLLDGPKSAQELVPALQGWTSPYLMRLYEQVPCPQAVPMLLRHLSQTRDSSRAALVAQTRVDLGYNVSDWQSWLASRDKTKLVDFEEPSAPLWKAIQGRSDLSQSLMKQPRLIARFDLCGDCEDITVLGGRLIRLEGNAHNRTLEWSLVDGRALATLPASLSDNAEFRWNWQRRLLYYHYSHYCGLWHGQSEVFAEDSGKFPGGTQSFAGKRPSWLPSQLYDLCFSQDGSYVQGSLGGKLLRISIDDGTHQSMKEPAAGGLTSPDGNFWLGREMLMDKKKGLIHRPALPFRHACFSPDSQTLVADVDEDIALFDVKNFRMIRKFPIPERDVMSRLAFDDSGRYLTVLGNQGSVWVYDLHSEPPDLTCDSRLVAECWTGYRLSGGGARKLTEAEYWDRRRRLAETSAPAPNPYIPLCASIFGIGLLGIAFLVTGRAPILKKSPIHRVESTE